MTRSRLVLSRLEGVEEAVDRFGLTRTWESLLVAHARRLATPSTPTIVAAMPDAVDIDDLLDGLDIIEVSMVYEFSLAYADRDDRKQQGQFFTPDDVADFLAERAMRFPAGTWIDPCCGVGNLSFALARRHPDPERFVAERLVLVDRDPLALRIACALLALTFERTRPIWAELSGRAHVGDALTMELPYFDFAILNPPYVQVAMQTRFDSAESRDLYAYFVERMVKAGSGVVAITPQSYTSARKFRGLRRLLVQELAVMDIYCFDNVPDNVFRGIKHGSQNSNRVNSTRAAVLVGLRDGAPTIGARRHRITPLLRWRAHERAELLASADSHLADLLLDEDRAFPKVSATLAPLHHAMLACATTVGDLIVREVTPFHLDVPATPRYFLSAVKRPLFRASSHRLHFATADHRDLAYVVLNSSLAYWWWRVYEGGITVSSATLASLPVPLDAAPPDLVAALEASEAENVVVKQNAGRANENVKHPWPLLRRLNAAAAPAFVDDLMAVHANSHVAVSVGIPATIPAATQAPGA